MRVCLSAAWLICAALASAVVAQEGPSFDCANADGAAEDLICADPELAGLDRRLAARYAAALAAVRGLDSGAQAAEDELRATQRGWIAGRDECWKVEDLHDCVETSYLRREGALVARWMLEIPTGTAFWACGGNPANEVVTAFFATELPSVRFERRDTIETGWQVRSGSGARYASSFGREIWIKGQEARYREPDPDGTVYGCVLSRED